MARLPCAAHGEVSGRSHGLIEISVWKNMRTINIFTFQCKKTTLVHPDLELRVKYDMVIIQ